MTDQGPTSAPRTRARRKSGLQENLKAAKAAEAVSETSGGAPGVDAPSSPSLAGGGGARPAMRPPLRDELDPRERARLRTLELLEHGLPEEGEDKFWIDRDNIPPGWDYEWKTLTVLNKEDPSYQTQLARGGWEPVPANRHPDMMPRGSKSLIIERDGMVLMERPVEITKRVRMADAQRARQLVKDKEAALQHARDGQFERSNKGQSMVEVKRGYAPMPVPDE